ncbi:DUF6082 family protein [Actinoplanes awajinensis]|uniref:Uncharacterized protein n=1 Tax=Actinoplanes awajinensis subsp. mycoplanecinus TaxID=135947 RepID=A0A101J8W3_9ACTN|nr:DUF6082 family protein [Actinoplanes awajinensis]KUL22325.1 hypothetical protein ADL15_48175 [Actinoplanes awajinensis subsp. mycoplanecinus]
MVAWMNETRPASFRQVRWGIWTAGSILAVTLVLTVPLVMVALSGAALPWTKLADVGDAFGGASAVLSAVALSGVGASLLFQQRQIRQELADLDRQQHMELLKLAIENPELIEVLDSDTAAGDHPRHEVYANLTLMYWLAIWQLGEIDDDELRRMSASMFRSPITRRWWTRVGGTWIGTRLHPERGRFLEIITLECQAAASTTGPPDIPIRPTTANTRAFAVTGLAVLAVAAALGHVYGRRIRSARTSSMKERQTSAP